MINCYSCTGCFYEPGGYVCDYWDPDQPIQDADEFQDHCCYACTPIEGLGLCCCSYEGYTFSSSCECRRPRHALFSVSRQVRADVIATFYSCNQFFVTPYQSPLFRIPYIYWPPACNYTLPKVELSLYLSSIDPTAFRYIRWLEWIHTDFPHDHLHSESPGWHDYLDMILLMEHAINLPRLTLIVNFAASGRFSDGYRRSGRYPNQKSWNCLAHIVAPFQRLAEAGLKDFFVYVGFINSHTSYDTSEGITPATRIRREKWLEGLVMGQKYDSSTRAKPSERVYALKNRYEGGMF